MDGMVSLHTNDPRLRAVRLALLVKGLDITELYKLALPGWFPPAELEKEQKNRAKAPDGRLCNDFYPLTDELRRLGGFFTSLKKTQVHKDVIAYAQGVIANLTCAYPGCTEPIKITSRCNVKEVRQGDKLIRTYYCSPEHFLAHYPVYQRA